jgi:two-component system response regulator AtoC
MLYDFSRFGRKRARLVYFSATGGTMKSPNLLIVEKDPRQARLLNEVLVPEGFECTLSGSLPEAEKAVLREDPKCIILSLDMERGEGGRTPVQAVRSHSPHLPIIALSGGDSVQDVVDAMRDGATDCMRRPVRPEELLLKVRMVLDGVESSWGEKAEEESDPTEEYDLLFNLGTRMENVKAIVDQVADTDITVLITGESGTGKELVARSLHKSSGRSEEPFIRVNCAALPRDLLESELFGFEKGAFTGAHRRKYGRFEMARNGTIFLDEISELHPDLQSKLLHVLQEKVFFRVGGEHEVQAHCRILAATNKNLERMVEEGKFRRDLFYRVNVVNITIPSLRERKEDIPAMAEQFLRKYRRLYQRGPERISGKLMELFQQYFWPGNVRELENHVKRCVILGGEAPLLVEFQARMDDGTFYLPAASHSPSALLPVLGKEGGKDGGNGAAHAPAPGGGVFVEIPDNATLKEVTKLAQRRAERELIERVLLHTRWNRRKAAAQLDISYKALLYKIKECGLCDE